ncbi:Type II restriction endonuclease, TdeIII [Bacillus sp. YF23]|uniref:TdeIII family type II restriction endonuclease n=1 Tax=Bacillus sp. YF23 TaxID=691698 RepID=UPI000BF53CEF|nr:TdeIII family type II restriction endonuclease [Bacillus sp. YF23]PFG72725.1 Type II restriction endonuclease, TdeIII [Bacillus sp. YF23]
MNEHTKQQIKNHLAEVMEKLIHKRTVKEPFNQTEIASKNPFGFHLVPSQVWKGSKFERSFVTTLGQRIFEQIGKIIAEGAGAFAENQYDQEVTINTWRSEQIDTILREQRSRNRLPNWEEEVTEILALNNPITQNFLVKSDLYIRRTDGTEEFYSFKTVKPNLDQTELAKKNMFRLIASDQGYEAYFGLPYNPAGEGNLYRSQSHKLPFALFEMDYDPCVLIGAELWNKIGDDENTYDELLSIFEEVGAIYSQRIQDEYFNN